MRERIVGLAAMGVMAALGGGAAWAGPGGPDEVYGARVTRGKFEAEFRGARFQGGADGGEAAGRFETSYGITSFWRPAVLTEIERKPGQSARVETVGFENLFFLTPTKAWPVQLGLYGEYEIGRRGAPDKVELRFLTERQQGRLDLRANFVVEKELAAGEAWELGYAAQASYQIAGDFRLGAEGFGEFGETGQAVRLGRRAHFWGPLAKFELIHAFGGEVEADTSYLFGFGGAEARGQLRIGLEWERRF